MSARSTRNFLFLIFTVCVLCSCRSVNPDSIDSFLINCWTDSYEESSGQETDVYRHCDFKEFPASRYRNSFTLHKDGNCSYLILAPNDAHSFVDGKWTLNKDTLTIINLDSQILMKRFILKCDGTQLTLEKR